MNNNLVSIIMPNYNGEKYICETINSILAQTYKDWELWIVDDCSNDNSIHIMEHYSQKDPRIKYAKQEVNAGAAAARNIALKKAEGRYIAFLDSDDIWAPNKLKKQVEFMQKNGYAFTFTEYKMCDENGYIINERVASPSEITYRGLLTGYALMCSSVVIDRSITGEFRMPNIRSGQDYATWAKLMRTTGISAYNIGEPLSIYRKMNRSLSGNKFKALKRTWKINRQIEKVSFFKNIAYLSVYAIRWVKKHFLSVNRNSSIRIEMGVTNNTTVY